MPAKQSRKLTNPIVEGLRPGVEPYRLWDVTVPQLHVRVQPSGVKSWNLQWSRTSSKALGKHPGVTVEAARERAREVLRQVADHGQPLAESTSAPLTVADVCREYVEGLRRDKRPKAAQDAERRFSRTIYGDQLGTIPAAQLMQKQLEGWRDRVERGDLAPLPTRKGRPPTPKPLSRAAFNRMLTPLKAALNRAVERREIPQDRVIEWQSVKPYKHADNRRDLYLDRDQRRALLANADGDIRDLMECIALTGCRPGDPAIMLRRDYEGRTGSVTFRSKDHPRTVPVSPAAKALFDRLAKDKLPKAHMFTNAGAPWASSDWSEPVRVAAAKANLPDGVVLYTLRHCWITDAINGGMDLLTVAKLSGTSLAMIEKHYGHLVHGAAREKLAEVSFL